MRVLVTGATGFVGYVVATALGDAGHEVWGLSRSGGGLPPGVEAIPGDLFSLRVTPFDGVCHLAALARVRDSRADPLGYWRTNVGGTLALLDALVAQGGPPARVVVASTCAVYRDDARARGTGGRRGADPAGAGLDGCAIGPAADRGRRVRRGRALSAASRLIAVRVAAVRPGQQ